MSHLFLLPLLLYMDFGGNATWTFRTENCLAIKSNTNIFRFNKVCHIDNFSELELEEIKKEFSTKPFCWAVNIQDQQAAMLLQKHKFIQHPEIFSAMSANITTLKEQDYAPHISIREIDKKKDIKTWIYIATNSSIHCEQSELIQALYNLLEKGSTSIRLYLGFYKEIPCTASMIIYHGTITSLHFIGTLPEYRKKGLGYAITHKSLLDASHNGIIQAILLSSTMGQSLYKQLGFQEYAQYYMYKYNLINT